MPRQSDRYALDLNVDLYASHQWRRVAMQDLSRTGHAAGPVRSSRAVILGICDTPERLPARVFLAVAGRAAECPCCSFWRGTVFGAFLAGLAGAAWCYPGG